MFKPPLKHSEDIRFLRPRSGMHIQTSIRVQAHHGASESVKVNIAHVINFLTARI